MTIKTPTPIPICIDPPLQTKLRAPLVSTFTPKAVKALEPDIRALAERLVDGIAGAGRCEFMHEVADLYPVEIFLKMFGLPLEREREYRELAKQHLTAASPDPMFAMNMLRGISECMRETILERRKNPQADLISLLWTADIDGAPMTFTFLQFTTVAALAVIPAFVFEPVSITALISASGPILYVGVLSSAATFTFLAIAMKHTSASEAAVLVSLETLFAAIAGAILLGEQLPPVGWFGASLLFMATLLVQLAPRAKALSDA